jgi:hypothetical protein
MMTREELRDLAKRHSLEIWHPAMESHEGDVVMRKHGIDEGDATELAIEMAAGAIAVDTVAGQAALFLQGLILGLWIVDQERGE